MTEFQNVTVCFDKQAVIEHFSYALAEGSKTLLIGSSGIGKTTLLRVAAGLLTPNEGQFIHTGKTAIMFQGPRLLPWRTALQNVCAVLTKSEESTAIAEKYLKSVGLSEAACKYPRELSGGMAQRVSFARFLAYAETIDADLLLLDEPFSALDSETAEKMLGLLRQAAVGKTLLMVSHDAEIAEVFNAELLTL